MYVNAIVKSLSLHEIELGPCCIVFSISGLLVFREKTSSAIKRKIIRAQVLLSSISVPNNMFVISHYFATQLPIFSDCKVILSF